MDSSLAEAGLRRQPTSHRLPSDGPRNVMSSLSPNVPLSNRDLDAFMKPAPSNTSHIPSHYHELRQLETTEEDLIQFTSRPPTPHAQPNAFEKSAPSPSSCDASKDQPQRYALQSRFTWY